MSLLKTKVSTRARTADWKVLIFLAIVGVLGGVILAYGFSEIGKLPLWGWEGFLTFGVLVLLTVACSRFTVPVTNIDGVSQSYKSAAEAFIFLAVMMYALAPANNVGPAIILAGIGGFISSFRLAKPETTVFTIGTTIISTFGASLVYKVLVLALASGALAENQRGAVLNILLFPLCVFGLVQYALSTAITSAYSSFHSSKRRLSISQESLMWSLMTQVAGVTAAALFYSAIHEGTIPFLFIGFLIIVLVHFLYRFNEKRLGEVKRAEADKLKYAEEIAELHMNTIESLAIAIDAKDQTTHGHVRRTQLYATEMGKLLKVSDQDSRALVAGALLHDIGKLAVPEYILNKPGKLTESEFAKMKIHPTVGGDILKRVNFPYPVEDIVRYHHEKWNGTGYPKGLKAEHIPLVARIISVVDFYDATRCDRPYRKGMKREDSVALLQKMAGSSFDPKVVDFFIRNVSEFDRLIDSQDIEEQVPSENIDLLNKAKPDAGLASEAVERSDNTGFRSITEAQREVFALHEIAQTIGSSLNMNDTVTLISNKLRAIVPFDSCIIFIVDDHSGKAIAIHAGGDHAELFYRRQMNVGEGITGWVIANGRSMCNSSPELDLIGVSEEIARNYRGVLVSPLIREDGAFGAIALYSKSRTSYTTEHVRLLESVAQHAASALNNAITFEKTKESALTDALTDLPNARGFYMVLEQRLAECQRMNRESLSVISMDIDDFRTINDQWGHAIGDRLLSSVGRVIRKELRQMDILSRYAGDEFVAIMPMASTQMAGMVAQRIRKAVAAHEFQVRDGKMVRVTVSTGVSCFPADGETTEELLTAAARHMQQEKNARKNLVNLTTMPVSARVDHYT